MKTWLISIILLIIFTILVAYFMFPKGWKLEDTLSTSIATPTKGALVPAGDGDNHICVQQMINGVTDIRCYKIKNML